MSIHIALVAMSIAAQPAFIQRAGEWSNVTDNGAPKIACVAQDEPVMDQKTLQRRMSQFPGATCNFDSVSIADPVATFAMRCNLFGSQFTSTGTMTMTGPDSFTTKMHMHGSVFGWDTGQMTPVPDHDMTTVYQRLGPCKPGDPITPG